MTSLRRRMIEDKNPWDARATIWRTTGYGPGSVADFQGWAKVAKNVELVGQETESTEGTNMYVHYVKRTA